MRRYTSRMSFGAQDIVLIGTAGAFGLMAGTTLCDHVARGARGLLARYARPARTCAGMACGVACAALAGVYGFTTETVELILFACVLCHLSLTDIDRREIPNADLVLALGIRLAYLLLGMLTGTFLLADVRFYLMSFLVILAVLLALILIADRFLGDDSMGGGDIKLLAVCALYLGWFETMVVLFVSCVLGLLSVVPSLLRRSRDEAGSLTFPFGPSIAIATVLGLLVFG